MTLSKRSSSPASRCIGWSSVSWSRVSAPGTPCRSMLSRQMDHAEASLTWPQRRRFVGSPPRLLDELAADDEHAARAAARVIHTHPRRGFEDAHHEPDDIAGCVEVAALVALCAEEADMVEDVFEGFIGLAERAKGFVEDAPVSLRRVVELILEVGP